MAFLRWVFCVCLSIVVSGVSASAQINRTELDRMLRQLETARQSFDQAAQGGAGNTEQARQQAESALQQIEQNLSQIEQQGGSRMQQDIKALKSDLEQARPRSRRACCAVTYGCTARIAAISSSTPPLPTSPPGSGSS